jgi:hypothetical protein
MRFCFNVAVSLRRDEPLIFHFNVPCSSLCVNAFETFTGQIAASGALQGSSRRSETATLAKPGAVRALLENPARQGRPAEICDRTETLGLWPAMFANTESSA